MGKTAYIVVTENPKLGEALVKWLQETNQEKGWKFLKKYYQKETDQEPSRTDTQEVR